MPVRTNLVTNPSAENSNASTGWANNGGRASGDTAGIHSGSYYFHCGGPGLTFKTVKLPATAGLPYTASAWFNKSSAVSRTAAVSLHFFDAANVELEPPTVTPTSIVGVNAPERRWHTRTAPAGTTQAELWLHPSSTGVNTDGVMLEQSATLGDYFDGSTIRDGYTYAWTGAAHASASTETSGTPSTPGTAFVKAIYNTAAQITTANPSVAVELTPAAGDVLVLVTPGASGGGHATAVTGCGATWTKNAGATDADVIEVWVGTGASSAGPVTLTASADTNGRGVHIFHLTGTSSAVAHGITTEGTLTQSTLPQMAGPGQIVIGASYTSQSYAAAMQATSPATGWVENPGMHTLVAGARWTRSVYRVPAAVESHSITVASGTTPFGSLIVIGDLPGTVERTNLLIAPSLERTGAGGWSGGDTVTRDNGQPSHVVAGSYYGAVVGSTPAISTKVPASAGLPYTASAYLSRSSGTRDCAVTVHFYDAANVELDPPTITTSPVAAANTPQRFSQTRTAPAGTTQAALRVTYNSSISIDAAMLEQSATLGSYFDGSTVEAGYIHGWAGDVHRSASVRIAEGGGTPPAGTVAFKRRESGAWVAHEAVPKVYTGGAWEEIQPQYWDGTGWVELP